MRQELQTPTGHRFAVNEMPSKEEIQKRIQMYSNPDFPIDYVDRRGPNSYTNVRYPSGAVGCITSARYTISGRFHITCDPRGTEHSYKTRKEAAHAERQIVLEMWQTLRSQLNA